MSTQEQKTHSVRTNRLALLGPSCFCKNPTGLSVTHGAPVSTMPTGCQ